MVKLVVLAVDVLVLATMVYKSFFRTIEKIDDVFLSAVGVSL